MPLTVYGNAAVPRDHDPHVSPDEHWDDADCALRGIEHDYEGDPNLVIPPSASDFWEKLKTEHGYGMWRDDPENAEMFMLDVISGLVTSICDECKRRILTDIFITLMVTRLLAVTDEEAPKPELVN